MRRHVQKQLLELAEAVWEGIRCAGSDRQKQGTEVILQDCFAGIDTIDKALSATLYGERYAEYQELLEYVKELLELLYAESKDLDVGTDLDIGADPGSGMKVTQIHNALNDNLAVLCRELKQEPQVKLEIVFMPYKASMWDCFDSIWKAADMDDRCNVSVVPIPYYDKNPDGTIGSFHYEGNSLPQYVETVNYRKYSIQSHRPDIVYIHNPYDGYNYVTTVPTEYYSGELRKYSELLVYIPYFLASTYTDLQSALPFVAPVAIVNSNYIVYQSYAQLEMLKGLGLYYNNALVLGSPKLDYYAGLKEPGMPQEKWETCRNFKKTILLTTTLDLLLAQTCGDDPYEWIRYMRLFLNSILQYDDLAVIWRPHPLMRQTVCSMRNDLVDEYDSLIQEITSYPGCILDEQTDSRYALFYSDALIADGGSMPMQYMVTEKPVLNIYSNHFDQDLYMAFDMSGAYFADQMIYDNWEEFLKLSKEEKQKSRAEGIRRFCEMILRQEDPKKDERLNAMRMSVVNSDGTAGEKIHKRIAAEAFEEMVDYE